MAVGVSRAQPPSCGFPSTWNPVDYAISDIDEGIAGDTLTGDIRFVSVFTIDSVLTIKDAVIGVTQNPLIVNPYDTLRLINTLVLPDTTFSSAFYLWTGIIVRPGGVLIMDSSTICFGTNGVFSQGNHTEAGEFQITNSLFRQNTTGLRISSYSAGVHPGRVTGTMFRGGLLPTASTLYSSVGIWVDTVSDGGTPVTQGVLIGDFNKPENRFDSLEIGIYGNQSSMNIQNNVFTYMNDLNADAFTLGYGIYSRASSPVSDQDINIGSLTSSNSGKNEFIDCRTAIHLIRHDMVRITSNELRRNNGPFRTGIYLTRSTGDVSIGKNILDTFERVGIWLDDNRGNDAVAIFENELTSSWTTTTLDNTGILVEQPLTAPDLSISINRNSVSGVQRGIYLEGIQSPLTTLRSNTMNIPWPGSTAIVAGIYLGGVDTALVDSNRVVSNCPTLPCINQAIRGINTRNSTRILLRENRLDTVGYGSLIQKTSIGGNANCNVMRQCGAGFGFDDIGLSGIIYGPVAGIWGLPSDTTAPSDNVWYPAATAIRTYCFGGSQGANIDWFYRDSLSSVTPIAEMSMPVSLNVAGPFPNTEILAQPQLTSFPWCGDTAWSPRMSEDAALETSEAMETWIASVMLNKEPWECPAPLYRYLLGFRNLHETSSMQSHARLWLGINELHEITEAIGVRDYVNARLKLDDQPTGLHAHSQELYGVYDFYLQILLREEEFLIADSIAVTEPTFAEWLTPDEYLYLYELSVADEYERGPAVHVARSLINTFPMFDAPFEIAETTKDDDGSKSASGILVFPNPAHQTVTISLLEDAQHVMLLDAFGRVLATFANEILLEGSIVLSVSDSPSGLYIVKVLFNNGSQQSARLVISRH